MSSRARAPLAGLLIGHAVSLTGNMLTIIALPLYVLAETGSPAATGVTGAVATAPIVLGGALGGVLVDRIGYRRASVLADLVSCLTIAAIPLLHVTVGLPFWALLVLVFLTNLLDTPGHTARIALLPEAAAAAGLPTERAIGWFEATERGARLLGAPVAGLLVATLGALPVLALDAATFVLSAVVVAVLVPARMQPGADEPEPVDDNGGYWRQFAAGVRFLLTEPLLRAMVLLVLVTNFFDATKTNVLLPVVAYEELGGATALGLLVGAMGGGALAGSLVFSAVGHRLPRRPTFVVAFALCGPPPFLSLAAGLPLPALMTIFVVAGFAAGAINPMIGAIKLERVPVRMRARVYGVIGAGAWAAIPLGALSAGVASEQAGTRLTLVVVGIGYLLAVLTPLLGGPWRTMERRQGPPSTPPSGSAKDPEVPENRKMSEPASKPA
ncbi:MFS transporter [Micromonospora endophytica]|uniref:MFS transporter n=1 Tax=Micromonospora endophytica TaxID=515350 RepID=A0A2W2DJ29_9ACTN|nr:MFS transporter [Micromonospora endophytica]PZF97216.1 MFS transporter [Micromonospora endophytica]RIW42184.1 MFS transporter [Micromonospora endophytica]BCJ59488.1 MFS transporter [Micromonospora endophytica]